MLHWVWHEAGGQDPTGLREGAGDWRLDDYGHGCRAVGRPGLESHVAGTRTNTPHPHLVVWGGVTLGRINEIWEERPEHLIAGSVT